MISLFQLATEDKSVTYLYKIFGSMSGIIYNPGQPSETPYGVSITLLGTMFKTFNSTVLAVGALIIVYTTIVGVISTAYEGEFMGRKYNNIWIPIRAVLGIAALVPSQSGYSGLQMIMMWVIMQGIGAADVLWNSALTFIDVAGSPYAQVTIPRVEAGTALGGLFQGMVCETTSLANYPNPGSKSGGKYYCESGQGKNPPPYCAARPFHRYQETDNVYKLGPGGACGQLELCKLDSGCDQTKLDCVACKAQHSAMNTIINNIVGPVAVMFTDVDYYYRDFYANSWKGQTNKNPNWQFILDWCQAQTPAISPQDCCRPSSGGLVGFAKVGGCSGSDKTFFSTDSDFSGAQNANSDAVKQIYWPFGIEPKLVTNGNNDFLQISLDAYVNAITTAVNKVLEQKMNDTNSIRSKELRDASKTGWILAGAYYYTLASKSGNDLKKAIPDLKMKQKNPTGEKNSVLKSFRNNSVAAVELLQAASNASSELPGNMPDIGYNDLMNDANKSFKDTISGKSGSNPLIVLTVFGQLLMLLASASFLTFILIVFSTTFLTSFNAQFFGTGLTENPASKPFSMVYYFLMPALLAMLGFLISFGGLLAIYVPLVPFMIFTFGAIGWMISTIETMVAGPLVALGILTPSGQHEVLGKADAALMLIFNVFLRPSLMIFGLMAAMLLASVVLGLVNAGFEIATRSMGALNPNAISLILILCVYVTIVITSLNKCFAAISIIPENAMRWISGQGERYGEAEGLTEAKRGVEAGARGAAGAGGFTGKQAQKDVEGGEKAFQKSKKKAEQQKLSGDNK